MSNVLVLTMPGAERSANHKNSTDGLESECPLCDLNGRIMLVIYGQNRPKYCHIIRVKT